MDTTIASYISNTVLGQLHEHGNMGVVPLFNWHNGGADYPAIQTLFPPIGLPGRNGCSRGLQSYLQTFQPVPGQRGLLVTINGEIIGLDILSSEQAYRDLHARLVGGYVLASLVQQRECLNGDFHDRAMSFFGAAAICQVEKSPWNGCGSVYHLAGPSVSGKALVVDGHVIQLSLFPTADWT